MDPLTLALIGQGVAKGGSALVDILQGRQRRQTPRYRPSAAEEQAVELLKRRMQEGAISPQEQQTVQSQVTRRAQDVASRQKSDLYGQLTARGLGQSAGVLKSLTQPIDTGVRQQVAQTQENLSLANERSKTAAEQQYLRYGQQRSRQNLSDALRQFQATQQQRQQVGRGLKGLAGAAGGTLSALGQAGQAQQQQQAQQNPWTQYDRTLFDQLSAAELAEYRYSLDSVARQRFDNWYMEQ